MKYTFFITFFATYCYVVLGQTERRAVLLQYRQYMIDVVSETMQEVEDLQWCNLKIPEISHDVHLMYFGRELIGEVAYTNGYLISIQGLDIVQSSVQQVWTWNRDEEFGSVDVRADMRMHNAVIGFDVVARLNDTELRYTSSFTVALFTYRFSIIKNMATNVTTATVSNIDANPVISGRMTFVPNDMYSELLGASFVVNDLRPGILAWGPDIFRPRAQNVITNKVQFPEACFNC